MRRTVAIVAALLVLAGIALVRWAPWAPNRPAGNSWEPNDRGGADIGSPDGDDALDPTLRGSGAEESEAAAFARGARRPSLSGIVRKRGRPIAARVLAYALAAIPAGTPPSWSSPQGWTRALEPVRDASPVATARSGANGAYRFPTLAKGLYRVAAVADDGARGTATMEVLGEGTIARDLAIAAGAYRLEGIVKDPAGNPWRGGVRAVRALDSDSAMAQQVGDAPLAMTDEVGRFAIGGLDAGRYTVQAVLPGSLRVDADDVWVPAEKELEIVVGGGMRPLSGRVVSDEGGAPIEGAVVVTATRGCLSRATTDGMGRFEVLASDSERTLFSARAAGYCPAAGFAPLAAKELVIRLSKTGRIAGRVTLRGDGSPVGGVTVLATDAGSDRPRDGEETGCWAVSGPDGRYEMDDVPASDILLTVRSGGFVLAAAAGRTGPTTIVTVRRGLTTVADLAVDRGVVVAGHVRDAAGKGLVGARIDAFLDGDDRDLEFAVSLSSALSAADGRFELSGLALGRPHHLSAVARGYFIGTAIVKPEAESTAPVEITLAEPLGVDVRVVGERDEPLPIAEVSCGGEFPPFGADGIAHLHWVMKDSVVRVAAPGRRDFEQTLGAPDASGAMPEVVARMSRVFPIAGRVTYADGAGAEGALIAYTDDGKESFIQSGADGRFRLGSVAAGDQVLGVRDLNHQPSAVLDDWEEEDSIRATVRAGDENVRIEFPWKGPPPRPPREPTILVRVLDADGAVVPSARIAFERSNGSFSHVEPVEGGEMQVARTFSALSVFDARSSSGSRLPLGSARRGSAPDGASEIEIRLPPERRVSGTVVDSSGRPVEGCRVTAETGQSPDQVESRTDAAGRFSIGSLGEGASTLSADPPAGFLPLSGVAAAEGASDVRLTLLAAARTVITVVDESGAPLAAARVDVYRRESEQAVFYISSNSADREGRVVVERLDPAALYDFSVSTYDRSALAERIDDVAPADRKVVLARAHTIAGFVRDPSGAPVAGANVSVRHAANAASGVPPPPWTEWVKADENGAFKVSGLEPGKYALLPGWQDTGQSLACDPAPEVTVAAGASDVSLVIDPGVPLSFRIDGYPKGRRAEDVRLGLAPHTTKPPATDEDSTGERMWTATPDAAGEIRFEHAPPGARYTLFVGPIPGGLCAFLADIRPGQGEIAVRLEKGQSIRGTLKAGGTLSNGNVIANRDGTWSRARTDDHGGFLFPALAPGRYRIEAGAHGALPAQPDAGPVWLAGSADAEAGSTIEIVLAPPK